MKANRRKRTIFALTLAVLAVGLTVPGGWYFGSLPRLFAEVKPGVLYRSGQGRPFQFRNAIRQNGIKTVICLREVKPGTDTTWLDEETRAVRENGVEFIHWPLSSNAPPDRRYWVDFLKMTQDPKRTPLLVHCAQGKHRTGFFVGLYRRVVEGWPLGKTLEEMDSFGFGLDTHPELLNTLKKIDPEQLRRKMKE